MASFYLAGNAVGGLKRNPELQSVSLSSRMTCCYEDMVPSYEEALLCSFSCKSKCVWANLVLFPEDTYTFMVTIFHFIPLFAHKPLEKEP